MNDMAAADIEKQMRTHHRYAQVNGRSIFYREAGDPAMPAIVLLHGFPASSHMFLELIPLLADRFHVIAPDYIGFGHSEAPPRSEFAYTFDHLALHVRGLLDGLGISSCIFYMHDYGGPIGLRIFAEQPDRIAGLVIQNANAYEAGVGEHAKQTLAPLWIERNPVTEKPVRDFLTAESISWQWTAGARSRELINPDHWVLDQALLDRPGSRDYNVDLFEDYKSNLALYDRWQAALRIHQPRTLIVWGKHDPFFLPAGAEAYLEDLPEARLVWLDAGHFVLDENVRTVAGEIRSFF